VLKPKLDHGSKPADKSESNFGCQPRALDKQQTEQKLVLKI
jgi:hypothetical protein